MISMCSIVVIIVKATWENWVFRPLIQNINGSFVDQKTLDEFYQNAQCAIKKTGRILSKHAVCNMMSHDDIDPSSKMILNKASRKEF